MTCWACGNQTPPGRFCGACGAPVAPDGSPQPAQAARRRHAFAADPAQRTVGFHLLTTLLPHLPRARHVHFRAALAAVVVLLLLVGAFRETGTVVAATALLPLVFVLYLVEVAVYDGDPWLGIGVFGLGVMTGVAWAHFAGSVVSRAALANTVLGISAGRTLGKGVGLAVLAQVVVLVVPLATVIVDPMVDGLDAFVTAALGAMAFAIGLTATNLWPQLSHAVTNPNSRLDSAVGLLTTGLLVHLDLAFGTALIVTAAWVARTHRDRMRTSAPLGALVALVVAGILGLTDVTVTNALATLVIYAAALVVLGLFARVVVHDMLLAEADATVRGDARPCSHCGAVTPLMAFCVNCGIALRSTPKRVR